MKRIPIFRVGRHTDMNGVVLEFGEAELDQLIRSYDPKVHEAPIVIGHPKTNAPAYGWVAGLSRTGGVLEAAPKQVHPAFAELVTTGRYKKVSMSAFMPDSPGNPKPGSWYLRHVGFLGAQPPAVKGLPDVEFGEAESGVVEFAEIDAPAFLDSLRKLLVEALGEDAVREVFAAAADPAKPADPAAPPAAPAPSADLAERIVDRIRQAALGSRTSLERRMSKLERDIAERERNLRRREYLAFLEELVREGRPLPCKAPLMVAFLEALDATPAGVVSFGEGETRTASELFREEVLAKLPKRVEFGELSAAGPEDDDSDSRAIASEAMSFQEEQRQKGITITTSAAVAHVKRHRREG